MEYNKLEDIDLSVKELVDKILSHNKKRFDVQTYSQFFGVNHKVNSQLHRPDKTARLPVGDGSKDVNGELILVNKTIKVTRISTEFQKLITTIATSFGAGGDVILKAKATDEQKDMLNKSKDVWKRAKCHYKNYDILEAMYTQKEVAEIWYTNKDKELRCNIYKPSDGYELIPIYDGNRDLEIFALKYKIKENDEDVEMIDVYTKDTLKRLRNKKGGWENTGNDIKLIYGKMPVIYYSYDEVIYEGVQSLIERYELLLSNFADSNDYNGSPILFGNGEITGYADKGEQGKFVLGEGDADLKYVSNNTVSESVKLELETIKNLIFTLTLTPELSFDIMVNLGNVSGLAMDRILTGAHLKAKKIQKGAYGEGIQRRLNFIVSALSNIFPELENGRGLYITPQFNLFRISTEYEKITSMLLANGNLPLIDHETSIEETGLVEDPEQAMILIDKKLKEASINVKNNNANNSTLNV